MRHARPRLKTVLGLTMLGLLGAHMASHMATYAQSHMAARSADTALARATPPGNAGTVARMVADGAQPADRPDAPTAARLVRALEQADARPRPATGVALSFAPRPVGTPWRQLREYAQAETRRAVAEVATAPRVAEWPFAVETRTNEWARVATGRLNLRVGAGTGHAAITSFPADTRLLVLERAGTWVRVENPVSGHVGWMAARFLEEAARTAEAVSADAESGV